MFDRNGNIIAQDSGSYKMFRSSVVIRYGKAIDVSDMELEEANLLLRNKIIELLEEK